MVYLVNFIIRVRSGADGAKASVEWLDRRINRSSSSSLTGQPNAVETRDVPASCRQRGAVSAGRWRRRRRGVAIDTDGSRREDQSAGLAASMVGGLHQRQGYHGRGHLTCCLSPAVLHLQHGLLAVVFVVNYVTVP